MKLKELLEKIDGGQALGTVVLVAVLLLLRQILSRHVLRLHGLSSNERRQWLVRIRSLMLLALLVGIVFIWAEQLRTFSLTLMAFAVAVVIATKELILCIAGAVVRASTQSFRIGDRIEVKGQRGWVIDHSLLGTTLLEIGPGHTSQIQTGRTITIPNSVFLSEPLMNETYLDEFVYHVFTVPLKLADDWEAQRERLLAIATEACAPWVAAMKERADQLAEKHGIGLPSVEARVAVRLPEPEQIDLTVRVPVSADRRGAVEQDILKRFLAERARPASEDAPTT